jgi:O-antigen/teichoic acid export membrane protein
LILPSGWRSNERRKDPHVTEDGDRSRLFVPHPASFAMNRSRLAFRGVFWSAVNVALPTAVNLVVFVVTSRILTPVDFGIVALALGLASLVSAVTPAGFGEALVQRVELRPDHLDSVFWMCAAVGLVAYGALVAGSGALAVAFDQAWLTILLPILGVKVVTDTLATVPNALTIRQMAFHLLAVRTIAATVVSAAVSLGLVLAGYGLWALVAAQMMLSVTSTIVVFWAAGWWPRLRFSRAALGELRSYGVYASGTRSLSFLMGQVDGTIVGFFLGANQLGFYAFSRRVFNIVNDVLAGSLSAVSLPLFSGIQHEPDRVRRGFLVATFVSAVVAFPVFAGLALVADRAIPLFFGPQWDATIWPVRILSALGLITCIGMLQSGLINSRGRANWWFYYQLLSGATTIAIIAFTARYGITLMLALVVAKTYLFWPITIAMTLNLLGMRLGAYLRQFAPPLLAAVAMAEAVIWLRLLWPDAAPLPGLAADVAAGALTYGLVMAVLGLDELRRVARVVLGMARRV